MTNKVRCQRCRGQKKYAGIGGVMKDCEVCDSTGFIERELKIVPQPVVQESVQVPEGASVVEDESAASDTAVADEKDQDLSDVAELSATSDLGVAQGEKVVYVPVAPMQVGTILPGYDDEFMRAILAEPTMDAIKWAAAYKHVTQLFGINPMTKKWDELLSKVQRASIREMYAMSKPIKERRVDLGSQQDDAVKGDPEYKKYQANEKKREADAAKKKNKNTGSGVGGM